MTGNINITNCSFKKKFNYLTLASYSAYYSADKSINSVYIFFKIKMFLLGVFVDFKQTLISLSLMLQFQFFFKGFN